jgi:hypothetical protein
MKLLICIAFHYNPDRIKYLTQIIDAFLNEYKIDLKLIVDTNVFPAKGFSDISQKAEVIVHENLAHPFHLTWLHRKHIKDNIDNYDCFAYFEDDMYLPFENFKNYLENFRLLWPKYVPSFVRIEQKDRQDFISDVPEKQPFNKVSIGGKEFNEFKFPFNYHAFWIMPQKELKESMKNDFTRLSDGREFAAMYTGWEIGKTALVELEDGMISKKSYSYHLPNNYALAEGHPNGKIKVEEIFI